MIIDKIEKEDTTKQEQIVENKKRIFEGYRKKIIVFGTITLLIFGAMQALVLDAAAQTDEPRILTFAMAEAVDSANPFVCIIDNAYIFNGLIYDQLMVPDEDLINRPNLAISWWYMDGNVAMSRGADLSSFPFSDADDWPLGSIWEYNLTDEAYWNDGEPFTADDVVWTINIQIGPNFMTYWAYQPYTRWITHAEKINDTAVRVYYADLDTKEPYPIAFGDNLYFPIMPKHAFENEPTSYLGQEWDGVPAIGTGPFKGTSEMRNQLIAKESITLVKNPYYNFTDDLGVQRGLGAIHHRNIQIDKIVMKFFSEETTLALAIKTGDADCGELQPSTYLAWQDDQTLPESITLINVLSCTAYSKQICLNDYAEALGNLNPLRLDPAVQRAAAIATNKTYIKDAIHKGLAVEGVGLISPAWEKWWWEPGDEPSTFNITDENDIAFWNYTKPMKDVMEYDPDLADEILERAGYEWSGAPYASPRMAGDLAAKRMSNMFGGAYSEYLGMEMIFEHIVDNAVFEDKDVGTYIIEEWEKIGIWIQTEQGDHTSSIVDSATWNTLIYGYTYNTMQTYWSGDLDPNYLCFVVTSYALEGWNEFGTAEDSYDQLYLKQASTLDYEERKYWVDECTKWQYLSGCIITTVYPEICFAISNKTWKNWGDWEAHPGMAIDAFWTENPLLWHIQYDPDVVVEIDPIVLGLVVGGIAALLIAAVAVTSMKKKKMRKMLTEEDEEEELLDEKGEEE